MLAHLHAEPRRRFPAVLHVGRPGGPEAVRPALDPADDHSLRVEVLEAMLRRVRALPTDLPADLPTDLPAAPALVWLTRPGPLVLQDVDAAWGAATRAAAAELGTDPLALVVVTRVGWWEPATGSGRRWRRLRVRP